MESQGSNHGGSSLVTTAEDALDSLLLQAHRHYGDRYIRDLLWATGGTGGGQEEELPHEDMNMDYVNEEDETTPEIWSDDVITSRDDRASLSADLDALQLPGQDINFDFENRILPGIEGDSSVTILNERNQKTSKEKRSLFKRNRKKKKDKGLANGLQPSTDSEDFAYDNHVALEGVENGYPSIIVSAVRDENGVIGNGDWVGDFEPSSSFDAFDDDVTLGTPEGTVRKKHRKRPKSRKFSVASALTDISFRSDRSNSTKVSSPSLLDVDWEADEDLRDSLNEFLQNRKGGHGGHKRRRKRSSVSTRSSDSEASDRETADLLDMYSGKQNDEERIFENIKIQKEIMETLRTQPWAMKKKLKTLQLAKSYVERYEGQLSRGHGYQEASAKYWKRVKREFMNFLSLLIPWEMRIKLIESYFGSVVASYFTFLRWLFWVNIVMCVLGVCFIVIPEILFGTPYGSIPQKTVPDDELSRALNFDTIMNWGYPILAYMMYRRCADGVTQPTKGLDAILGYLEYSYLFYGYYANTTVIGGVYRLPLAYLLVGLSAYAVSFLIILRKMTANARLNKLTSKDEQYTFMWKTFTSWDFMIGNAETAKNKVAEISTVLRETIEEEKERTKKKTTKTLIFARVVANMLVLIILVSSTYAINLVVGRSQKVEERLRNGENVGWWDQNEVSVVMSLITALFPSLFDLIGLMEKYHPRLNLRLQLGRILVLYLMNLYTLMFALYWKIVDKADAVDLILGARANCTAAVTISPDTVTSFGGTISTATPNNCSDISFSDRRVCWETMLGQEISKLVFFDLMVTVGTIVFIDFVRGIAVRYLNRYWCWDLEQKFPEYGEFKIAENLLHAIYNQATVWLGVFFAPLLPAVNILKLVIMLYVRSWAVRVCNIPHERVFRASRSNNFYFATLLLMLFLVTLPVAFLLVQLTPSADCGPFKGFERSYHVLTKTIENELPRWVNLALDYIASPGIIMPAILLLIMAIYYLVSLNSSLKESNRDLRNQLQYERTEEREKVYKMGGGARQDSTDKATLDGPEPGGGDVTSGQVTKVTKDREKDKDSGEDEETTGAPPPAEKAIRILRVPGMSLDQANLLKSKFPGVRVMSRDEAVRLEIVPPPPPPPPEPDDDDDPDDGGPEVTVHTHAQPDTDSPRDTSRESDYPDEALTKADPAQPLASLTSDYVTSDPVTSDPLMSDPVTSPLPSSRPVRHVRPAPGSSPPVAVVHGKPSMQSNRFRYGDQLDSSVDDAALF